MKEDKTLTCCECGNEFVFTASEQEFYAEKGFTNAPLPGLPSSSQTTHGRTKRPSATRNVPRSLR